MEALDLPSRILLRAAEIVEATACVFAQTALSRASDEIEGIAEIAGLENAYERYQQVSINDLASEPLGTQSEVAAALRRAAEVTT